MGLWPCTAHSLSASSPSGNTQMLAPFLSSWGESGPTHLLRAAAGCSFPGTAGRTGLHSVFRFCFNPPFQFHASLLPFSGISVSFYFWRHHTSHSLLGWGKGGCPQEPDGDRLEAVCCCCCFKQQNLLLVPLHSSFPQAPKLAPLPKPIRGRWHRTLKWLALHWSFSALQT